VRAPCFAKASHGTAIIRSRGATRMAGLLRSSQSEVGLPATFDKSIFCGARYGRLARRISAACPACRPAARSHQARKSSGEHQAAPRADKPFAARPGSAVATVHVAGSAAPPTSCSMTLSAVRAPGVKICANVACAPGCSTTSSVPRPSKTIVNAPSPRCHAIARSVCESWARAASLSRAPRACKSGHAWRMFAPSTRRCFSKATA